MLQKKVISGKEGLEQEFSSTVVGDLQYKLFDPLNVLESKLFLVVIKLVSAIG